MRGAPEKQSYPHHPMVERRLPQSGEFRLQVQADELMLSCCGRCLFPKVQVPME